MICCSATGLDAVAAVIDAALQSRGEAGAARIGRHLPLNFTAARCPSAHIACR